MKKNQNPNPSVPTGRLPLTREICNTGFTLIELLVAVTIGGLLVGFGSVSLSKFNDKQKIEAVSQEVLSNLRLARNYAITSQLPDGADRVVTTIDTEGLMEIRFQDATNNLIGSAVFSKDITPEKVEVVFNPDQISFSINDGKSIDSTSVGVTATASISGVELTKKINIDKSGLIYEE